MGATVLIVDDNGGFRAWARVLLESAGYTVAGEATDGASAIAAALVSSPEVMLLDVQLPDTDGFEVARRLAAERSDVAIVLTSTRDALDYGAKLGNCGARGFVPKDALSAEALAAVLADAGEGGDGDAGTT
jgi:two-component system nitrate/nitrite response regulator NarL